MNKTRLTVSYRSIDNVIESIGHRVSRETLQVLSARTGAIPTDELATHVAAAMAEKDIVDVTREERESIYSALVHSDLPGLVEAGLVEWDVDDQSVATTDHPAYRDRRFQEMLTDQAEDWDVLLRAIQSSQRREILSILDENGSMERRALARLAVAQREGTQPDDVPEQMVESVETQFHHVHIPLLQEAGLVVYDGSVARYAGHPELKPEWLELAPGEFLEDGLSDENPPDVWTIDGRENVITRGQALFDRADEELFLMFTADGLLEDGCVRRLQDATERGVDVYLGSQTKEVRDLVRREVPEATIWEPQLDWLNLPPNREMLGRLVFSDREAVMIATLGDDEDQQCRETAVTGEGEDNSLVVLLRQLLGSRLDHLDAQSEDFLSEIPL